MSEAETFEFLGQLAEQHQAAESAASGSWNKRAYKLGRWERSNRDHNPPNRSGDAAIYESSDLMNRRTRDMYLNTPMIKRVVDILRDLVVGPGIKTFADPIDYTFGVALDKRPESDLAESFDYALESDEKFDAWASDPLQCDVEGNQSFYEMQAMCLTEPTQVGDVLMLEVNRTGVESPVPLMYQIIEREQLDTSKDRPIGSGARTKIVNGIEFDSKGRELGAWIYDAHPYDDLGGGLPQGTMGNYGTSGAWSSTFVPAWRYHRIYKKSRPSQHIGATWLHAMGQPTFDRDKFLGSELRTAIKNSLMLLVATMEQGDGTGLGFENEYGDQMGANEISLGSSPIAAQVNQGESVDIVESKRPTNSANDFFDLIDHDLCAAANVSYYTGTGRFSKINYGGFKGALNLERAQMGVIQGWLGGQIVLPVRTRFNDLAAAAGVFTTMTASQIRRERQRFRKYDVIGPGRPLLDMEKETAGALGMLRGGLTTLKIELALRGLHWIRVLRQIHIENQLTDVLGIALDHSSGGGGNNNSNTRSADSESESESESEAEAIVA